jgi:hypothetical protein
MSRELLPHLKPINTGDEHYQLDIDYFLKHDYADIGEAMEHLPAIIEYLNEQRQMLREQLVIQKQDCKRLEAKAYFALKGGEFQDSYPTQKVSESAVGHAVTLDAAVIRGYDQLAVLVAAVERVTTTIITLGLKLELVRSTEATRRLDLARTTDTDDN